MPEKSDVLRDLDGVHADEWQHFFGVDKSADGHDPRRDLFDGNNPSLTVAEIPQKSNWYAINFAAGLVACFAMAVIVVTLAWPSFGGRSGLKWTAPVILEDAGNDWCRNAAPISGQESYHITIPSVSKTRNYASTVARAANAVSGPVFLLQPAA